MSNYLLLLNRNFYASVMKVLLTARSKQVLEKMIIWIIYIQCSWLLPRWSTLVSLYSRLRLLWPRQVQPAVSRSVAYGRRTTGFQKNGMNFSRRGDSKKRVRNTTFIWIRGKNMKTESVASDRRMITPVNSGTGHYGAGAFENKIIFCVLH